MTQKNRTTIIITDSPTLLSLGVDVAMYTPYRGL